MIERKKTAGKAVPPMTYIVFDLEWNQSTDPADSVPEMPFEILEIGAVKLDENRKPQGEFFRMIRPEAYRTLHFKIRDMLKITMEELQEKGVPFPQAFQEFMEWCHESAAASGMTEDGGDGRSVSSGPASRVVFCTWGNMDLTELQRNLSYYNMENPFQFPLLYYDLQKLYNRLYKNNSKDRVPLDKAVQELSLPAASRFHQALEDARCTAAVMGKMGFEEAKPYLSVDYYRLPGSLEEEICLTFPDYGKYVSRTFPTKEDAVADKTVTDVRCCRCGRLLRKKVRWFSGNQRNYYCLAVCPVHGLIKGKIRLRHAPGGQVYAVRTEKPVDQEGAQEVYLKKEEEVARRHRRREQNP